MRPGTTCHRPSCPERRPRAWGPTRRPRPRQPTPTGQFRQDRPPRSAQRSPLSQEARSGGRPRPCPPPLGCCQNCCPRAGCGPILEPCRARRPTSVAGTPEHRPWPQPPMPILPAVRLHSPRQVAGIPALRLRLEEVRGGLRSRGTPGRRGAARPRAACGVCSAAGDWCRGQAVPGADLPPSTGRARALPRGPWLSRQAPSRTPAPTS